MADPDSLSPLILCPVCTKSLVAPTTLRCGHSICSHHPLPCPVRACSSLPRPSSLPTHARVRYHPPPDPDPDPQPPPSSRTKLDVTLNKLLTLVSRTHRLLRDTRPVDDDQNDDDDDQPSPSRRPRKRLRRNNPHSDDDDDDLLSHLRTQHAVQKSIPQDQPLLPPEDSSAAILTRFQKDLLTELTCEICFVLLYQPVTTPCQHTFCAKCLQRSLDHSPSCPLCRQNLPGFTYFEDHPHNKSILAIILKAFPLVYQERELLIQQEERDARLDTPIFVCQLRFPGMPTLLHFFEPRYRLMLRRCLESPNPRFGMVMPPKAGMPQTDYGTMLEIHSVQMLSDGRSMVETWSTSRFRILERGTLDGYMVGRIERIDDYPEPDPEPTTTATGETPAEASSEAPSDPLSEPSSETSETPPATSPTRTLPTHPTNEELIATCRAFLDRLQRGMAPWVVQRLSNTYGTMPTDPSSFSFWVALVLPIDDYEKAKLLPIRSVRLRLLLLVHWIEQLNNNWYAWLCFVVRDGWILGGPARPIIILVWVAFVLMGLRLLGWI